MSSLKVLAFSDLFLGATFEESWYKETPDALRGNSLPQECLSEVDELRDNLEKTFQETNNPEFTIDWSGMRLRIERMPTVMTPIFVCRRFWIQPGDLRKLGFPSAIEKRMTVGPNEPGGFSEGLVLFCGKTGSGKSTSAFSYVDMRLQKYGGVCWTLENPVESIMQGQRGKGFCYQMEVKEEMFGDALRAVLRASPNIILLGEIRTPEAAAQAINAGTSGHVVVATMHGSDIPSTLNRLHDMIKGSSRSLSDALRMVIHQRLANSSDADKPSLGIAKSMLGEAYRPKRILHVDTLFLTGVEGTEGVRSKVDQGEFSSLRNEIERQRRVHLTLSD